MDVQIIYSRDPPVYFASECVEGHLLIRATEPYTCREVVIRCKGAAKNGWRIEKGKMSASVARSTMIYGRIDIISEEVRVWGECVGKAEIPVGQLQLPFSFKLPAKCLPSLDESFYGNILYSIKAEVDTGASSFNKKTETNFTVQIVNDIRQNPQLHAPSTGEKRGKIGFCLFRKGEVGIQAVVPRLGWAPKEVMEVDVIIDNKSSRNMDVVTIEMVRRIKMRAFDMGKSTYTIDEPFQESHDMDEVRRRSTTLREIKMSIQSEPETTRTYRIPFEIPETVPSFESAITRLYHELKVSICSTETMSSTISCQVPLVVGTIGLDEHTNHIHGSGAPPPTYKESLQK